MTVFELVSIIVSLAALFAWINHLWIRLPTTIGLTVLALLASMGVVALGRAGVSGVGAFGDFVASLDFDQALLHGMLGALLFAGALHIDLDDLLEQRTIILTLATAGVLLSTTLVGFGSYALFGALGLGLPLIWCLLFGALISPTDPIAVGAILRKAGVPPSLETKIAGESLFNDGVGVVIFVAIAGIATSGHAVSAGHLAELFLVEAGGGLLYGAVTGWLVFRMLKSVDNYQVEILLTLALVTGGYALANRMHFSGPLAMVIAGLLIGNRGRQFAMSDQTRDRLDAFWELVDEFLNAVLFVLIGIDVIVVELSGSLLTAAFLAIPLVLLARLVSVGIPVRLLSRLRQFSPFAIRILTWSGLRGGISVALALSLPAGPEKEVLVTVTYVVVCFSIVVQGLTVGPLTRRLMARAG